MKSFWMKSFSTTYWRLFLGHRLFLGWNRLSNRNCDITFSPSSFPLDPRGLLLNIKTTWTFSPSWWLFIWRFNNFDLGSCIKHESKFVSSTLYTTKMIPRQPSHASHLSTRRTASIWRSRFVHQLIASKFMKYSTNLVLLIHPFKLPITNLNIF